MFSEIPVIAMANETIANAGERTTCTQFLPAAITIK
jgi:hypothetical protein